MPRDPLPTPHLIAKRCVNSILIDLKYRKGFRQLWEELDEDAQNEIISEWRTIIVVELGGQPDQR